MSVKQILAAIRRRDFVPRMPGGSIRAAMGLLVLLCSPAARAQYMKQEVVFSVGFGLTDPTGLFEDEVKTGVNYMTSVELFLNPSWSLGLRGAYILLDAEEAAQQATGVTAVDYWNTDLETHLMLYPESWFTPYLEFGAGVNLEQTSITHISTDSQRDVVRFGLTGGVGINVHSQGKRWGVFTELIYHHMPSEGTSRQGVRWTTGLRISFGGRPF